MQPSLIFAYMHASCITRMDLGLFTYVRTMYNNMHTIYMPRTKSQMLCILDETVIVSKAIVMIVYSRKFEK